MGAKAILRTTAKTAIELTHFNRCYMLSETGEEIKVTKDMVRVACLQLLARCKK